MSCDYCCMPMPVTTNYSSVPASGPGTALTIFFSTTLLQPTIKFRFKV